MGHATDDATDGDGMKRSRRVGLTRSFSFGNRRRLKNPSVGRRWSLTGGINKGPKRVVVRDAETETTTSVTTVESPPPPPRPHRRRVRFEGQLKLATVACHLPICHEMSERTRRALWWTPEDFERFRAVGRALASEYRIRFGDSDGGRSTRSRRIPPCPLLAGIDGAYGIGRRLARHVGMVGDEGGDLDQGPPLFSDIDSDAIFDLAMWTIAPDGRNCRGLEHWASARHWNARDAIMNEARDVVLELQYACSGSGRRIPTLVSENTKSVRAGQVPLADEVIALKYGRCSRPAGIVARLLGEADAIAALSDVHDEVVLPMMPRGWGDGSSIDDASSSHHYSECDFWEQEAGE